MKPGLADIQQFVQQAVEAIAAAIGVEVMVFDYDLSIVAGTGDTKVEVGNRYNTGSLTGQLFEIKQPLTARSPGKSQECMNCSKYNVCPHYAVVAYPIIMQGEIIGSFCLVAISHEQRQHLLANEDKLMGFLDKMCQLIGNTVSERKTKNELVVLLQRYDNVVNSVHEGIIATDETGKIIHFNRSAIELLGTGTDQLMGTPLSSIFSDLPKIQNSQDKHKSFETELCYRHKGNKRYFLGSISPVLADNSSKLGGITLSFRNLSEIQSYATKLVNEYNIYTFDAIQGTSAVIENVKKKLGKAALTNSTVLLRGESGTGKELFAHAVHSASTRSMQPFIAINCSAIPESLLESELFGYEEGAFTGAKKGGKPGKFELARGGSIFLDEIGDMPLHLQSKLLRVLENKNIERIGGTESVAIDVRVIAATNRNLEEMIERREFRDDLYYRLSVIPVFIPPLRERPEDIPLLISHFLNIYCHRLGRALQQFDAWTRAILINYLWPGNVRELQNTVEYAVNMSEPGQLITIEHLPQRILASNGETYRRLQPHDSDEQQIVMKNIEEGPCGSLKVIGKSIEIEAILETLKRYGNHTEGKRKAAQHLGISLTTLYRRLRENN